MHFVTSVCVKRYVDRHEHMSRSYTSKSRGYRLSRTCAGHEPICREHPTPPFKLMLFLSVSTSTVACLQLTNRNNQLPTSRLLRFDIFYRKLHVTFKFVWLDNSENVSLNHAIQTYSWLYSSHRM